MVKKKPPGKDTEQSRRFIETAQAIEADESGESFEKALKKIVPPRCRPKKSKNSD